MPIIIRQETNKDYPKVFNLIKNTFKFAEHSDGDEHNLVERLRESNAFIPELSLVAEYNNEIIGHILFTKVNVGSTIQLALAPLSVSTNYQRQGVGTKLIKEGHRIAKNLGYEYSIVLGDPNYYSRFGYIPAKHSVLNLPLKFLKNFLWQLIFRGNSQTSMPQSNTPKNSC